MEKSALVCKVTLPPAGMITIRPVKVAVAPVKLVVPTGVPLA